jgi:hypothetical protein
MNRICLVLGTHNHLPHGTLAETFERAYQTAYKPFLSLLYTYPRIGAVLHYCGNLFDWLEAEHSEFIMLLKEMVRRKQVELLGGGYYAPVLSIIPDGDKLGQIEKLTTYLRTTFGVRPRGGWIAERVWEPGLARILCNSGLEYTFLDDRHFQLAGLDEKACLAPYLTEDQGKAVTVLPIHIPLVERMATQTPEQLILALSELGNQEGDRLAVLVVPGENLGYHGSSHETLYKNGWLKGFFDLLESNRKWLQVLTPRTAPEHFEPRGRVYFPCLSSGETMRSALAPARQRTYNDVARRLRRSESDQYLFGGFFRHYLVRYPEIGLLYARLIYTHIQVTQIRGDRQKKKAALDELWRGESGAAYWHGSEGGVYAGHLRKAVYRAFIEAERLARGPGVFMPAVLELDFDIDGSPEYLYQGKQLNALVHRVGASLLELDYLPRGWNYLDTVARWPEAYHRYRYEGCDWYLRKGFLDHFLPPNTDLERFDRMSFQELGDFLYNPFDLQELRREQKEVVLHRQGRIRVNRKDQPLEVRKRYRFKESAIDVTVTLRNVSAVPLSLWYASETNLALAGSEPASSRLWAVGEERERELPGGASRRSESKEVRGVKVQDLVNHVQVGLAASLPFTLWSLPLETVSYSSAGRVRNYQGTCLLPQWIVALEPGQEWEVQLGLDLRREEPKAPGGGR